MKNAVLISGIVAIIFICGVTVGHYRLPPFDQLRALKQHLPFGWRLDSWISLLRGTEPPGAIVMLGDSITAGEDWSRRFPNARIANLGVNGDTSAGVLSRLDDVIRSKPRMVLLMIGVNDLLRRIPSALVEAHIQFIASRLAENGIKPVVQSTLFVAREDFEVNDEIAALNDLMRRWCAEKGIVFIDVNAVLSSRRSLLARVTDDGLHLNDNGYALWSDLIRPYIEDKAN